MSFRRARSTDLPAILAIRFAVTENVLADPTKVTAAVCERYLEELGRGWVCEIEGEVVGFSFAARADSSIWALFVDPDFEGRGIGGELLRLAVDWLFELGSERVVLATGRGTRADAFYRAKGWQRGEERSDGEVCYSLPRAGTAGGRQE